MCYVGHVSHVFLCYGSSHCTLDTGVAHRTRRRRFWPFQGFTSITDTWIEFLTSETNAQSSRSDSTLLRILGTTMGTVVIICIIRMLSSSPSVLGFLILLHLIYKSLHYIKNEANIQTVLKAARTQIWLPQLSQLLAVLRLVLQSSLPFAHFLVQDRAWGDHACLCFAKSTGLYKEILHSDWQ